MFTKFKQKFQLSSFLSRIFTKNNVSKVLIIFTVGLISRITVGYYYDVNVFLEYYKAISLTYYSFMAIFVVVLGELFNYFNINIIPRFIFDSFTLIKELTINIFKALKVINSNIFNLFKSGGYTIKSILYYLRTLGNIFARQMSTFITSEQNNDKLIMGGTFEDTGGSNNSKRDFKQLANVLHKSEDNLLLPNTSGSNNASSNLLPSRNGATGVTENTIQRPLENLQETLSNTSKTSLGTTASQDTSGTLVFAVDPNNAIIQDIRPNMPTPSSIYSPYPREVDPQLYTSSQRSSNMYTPQTMTPLFPSSDSLTNPHVINRVNPSISSLTSREINNYYPAPLNLPLRVQGNTYLYNNSTLSSPTFDLPSVYLKRESITSSLSASCGSFNNQEYINLSPDRNPYPLSANATLANTTFNEVNNIRNPIIRNSGNRDNILPVIPRNLESDLDNIANTPRIDDPCSVNYQSKHNQRYTNPYNLQESTQMVNINKPGLLGKAKLSFKSIGNKIESAYLKYETVSKRHIIWSLFEESSGKYADYKDFKKNWDSNTSLWDEIKRQTKKDLKADIEGLLGIKDNKPAINTSINREIEDLLGDKRPFHKLATNTNTNINNSKGARVINAQEESSNTTNRSKRNINSEQSRRHRHGHHHVRSRGVYRTKRS